MTEALRTNTLHATPFTERSKIQQHGSFAATKSTPQRRPQAERRDIYPAVLGNEHHRSLDVMCISLVGEIFTWRKFGLKRGEWFLEPRRHFAHGHMLRVTSFPLFFFHTRVPRSPSMNVRENFVANLVWIVCFAVFAVLVVFRTFLGR